MTQASTTSMQAERAQGPLLPKEDGPARLSRLAGYAAGAFVVAAPVVGIVTAVIRWWLS
jgi:hypothetical protein